MPLTDQQIEDAKKHVRYTLSEGGHHEHPDTIRLAYEWLDAQRKLANPNKRRSSPLKHIIENWAGRYVSQTDVDVAAYLHPDINGEYPYFNISSRFTRPNDRRLAGIGEAKTQDYGDRYQDSYAVEEA